MRRLALVLFTVLMSLVAVPLAHASSSSEARARTLYKDALRRIATGSPDQRQFARSELEDANHLDPANADIALALGRLYLDASMLLNARALATDVTARDSSRSDAQFLLGEAWRRDWLMGAEDGSRDRSIACLARGLRRSPKDFAHACMLVPLLVDAGESEQARDVATLAARAAAADPEAWLLVGYAAQGTGDCALSDRMFRKAIPVLPPGLRKHYEDVSPLLPSWMRDYYQHLASEEREPWHDRFWRDSDPDPVTEENEAQLEFWARVTHAWLLYGMTDLGDWDMRAQLYIRFGAPRFAERNPMLNRKAAQFGNWLVWTYPDLGMRVWMEAADPLGHYRAPFSFYETGPVRPFPDSLARRPELMGVQGGWAVFRTIPADRQPLDVRCALAQFEGASSRRLLAQAESPATPASHLVAEWVVLDSASQVAAKARTEFGASACAPTDARSAGFLTDLSPGRYRLAVRVDDGEARRGVVNRAVVVPAVSRDLALSDLVVVCGGPELSIVPGAGIRLEPNTGLVPFDGDELHAYFEIYHLSLDSAGTANYEYVCTIRRVERDRRSWLSRAIAPRPVTPPIEITRSESTRGELRRQFFSVPVRDLPAGEYVMEVLVRDSATGSEARTAARFAHR